VDEGVRVTTVPGEAEAEAFCQLLRQNGIECAHRLTEEEDSPFENFGLTGCTSFSSTRGTSTRPARS
jgi:hypothetical protein